MTRSDSSRARAASSLAPPPQPAYLERLNEAQRAAVEATEGPLLVLSGAGTGKTRVLTTRLAHILRRGLARPGEILAVTFTNKAAREMKERVAELIGPVAEGMAFMGTFHALAARILRRHAELVGLKSNFTILDTDDQIRLLKQLLEAEGIDQKRWPARFLASTIDHWKNRGLNPDKVPSGDGSVFAGGRGIDLYRQYQERLAILNACDFGDLLLHNLTIFQAHEDVLAEYQRRFRYILVDEYQDTNVCQYLWLRLLARGHMNICCVGDDDQSIYRWRGAEVDNILRFESDFPNARVIRLERNYRSTSKILAAASGLIAANESRLGKTLWTDRAEGERVKIVGFWDAEEEARTVCDLIERYHGAGEPLSDMAILVRASFQMREFEDRFLMVGIPYRVVGGPRFYEREEIRDANAYLRLIAQNDDDLAMERIVNKPRRGLGEATLSQIASLARAERIPLSLAARRLIVTDEITARARSSLSKFLGDLDRWTAAARTMPHTELAELVLDESGLTAMWQADKSPQAAGKLENLKELVRSMDGFDSLGAYLEHIALVMEREEASEGARVTLMTMHAAKGLEYATVFLPGWEEGLFPHQRSLDESGQAGLEEERRLAYVGLTRAKDRAIVSFAANRRVHGSWQAAIPSRFVGELPADAIEVAVEPGLHSGRARYEEEPRYDSHYPGPGWRRMQEAAERGAWGTARGSAPLLEAHAELVATSDPSAATFEKGERIFHKKFGYGRVVEVDGNKLGVEFEHTGLKRVIATFVERHGR
ncbi:MAG: UvrD-helicase domain-containing protein [Alphaproteobacteria bacterium]|nr:UvrD-helicase domain-containing protein [Alphaproteobacteria bacterium]